MAIIVSRGVLVIFYTLKYTYIISKQYDDIGFVLSSCKSNEGTNNNHHFKFHEYQPPRNIKVVDPDPKL